MVLTLQFVDETVVCDLSNGSKWKLLSSFFALLLCISFTVAKLTEFKN